MGLKCKVRRVSGEIESVKAPNGQDSILADDALGYTGDRQTALKLWATAFTPEFEDYFGHWREHPQLFRLDANGEPLFQDVLHFLQIRQAGRRKLSLRDRYEIRNMMQSLGMESFDAFFERLHALFYTEGRFAADPARLVESGIYDAEEATAIAADREMQRQIRAMLDAMQGAQLRDGFRDRSPGLTDEQPNPEFRQLIGAVCRSEKNRLGKRIAENPSVVHATLAETLGGLTGRNAFADALYSLPYPEIIERYDRDSAFADALFEHYAAYTAVPEVQISPEGIEPKRRDAPLLFALALPDSDSEQRLAQLSGKTDLLAALDGQAWTEAGRVRKLLQAIALDAAQTGLDLTELPDLHEVKSREEMQDFLLASDAFLHGGSAADYTQAYRRFFGISDAPLTVKRRLDKRLQQLSTVWTDEDLSSAVLFDEYGLIALGDGLYHRVDMSLSNGALYDSLRTLVQENPEMLPAEAYPSAFLKKGVPDPGKLRSPDNREQLLESLRLYIRKQMQAYTGIHGRETEKLVLFKTIFGHPLNMESSVHIAAQEDRFYFAEDPVPDTAWTFPFRFYRYMLTEKAKRSELYASVLSHFSLSNDGVVKLTHDDPQTGRDIAALMPEGDMRRQLVQYVATSRHPSLQGLFADEIRSGRKIREESFERALYVNNPELLPEFRGQYHPKIRPDGEPATAESVPEEQIEVKNTFDGFIRIGDRVYYLEDENADSGFYRHAGSRAHGWRSAWTMPALKRSSSRWTQGMTQAGDAAPVSVKRMYPKDGLKPFEC
jgi:hypothetical protein